MDDDRMTLPARSGFEPATAPVPMLPFLAGTCRAAWALLRFWIQAAREPSTEPIDLQPRTA